MPIDLKPIVEPRKTAVLVIECQEGVIGSLTPAPMKGLAEAARSSGMLPRLSQLLEKSRAAGVKVFYCTFERRPDGLGQSYNTPLMSAMDAAGPGMVKGSRAASMVPELAPAENDFIVPRLHGMIPFHDTELDILLRNLGIGTVIPTGVSLNVAIPGTVFEAVNRGYRVVLPADCVAGYPLEYGEAVLRNSLRPLTFLTTAADLARAWGTT